jgi:ribosome-interacting GTPase 1
MLSRKEFNRRIRQTAPDLEDELEDLEIELAEKAKAGADEKELDPIKRRISDIEQQLEYDYEDYKADVGDQMYHAMKDGD